MIYQKAVIYLAEEVGLGISNKHCILTLLVSPDKRGIQINIFLISTQKPYILVLIGITVYYAIANSVDPDQLASSEAN